MLCDLMRYFVRLLAHSECLACIVNMISSYINILRGKVSFQKGNGYKVQVVDGMATVTSITHE